jgi:hypothetical protein
VVILINDVHSFQAACLQVGENFERGFAVLRIGTSKVREKFFVRDMRVLTILEK